MDKGAGEAILFNAVAMHSEDCFVLSSAFLAVRNLCADCNENQTAFLDLGVVDPVLSAMKKHRNVPAVQEAGARVLFTLAENNDEIKKAIEDNGGIKLIVRAILDHSNNSKDKGCAGANDLYVRALVTLTLDSNNADFTESCSPGGGNKAVGVVAAITDAVDISVEEANHSRLSRVISAVIDAMEKHENTPAVQETGCAILGGLADLVDEAAATHTDQTKMDIVDHGALDVINMAMVLHRHEPRVQQRACVVLLSLAIEENYAAMMAAIGIQLLQDAATAFPDRCHDPVNKIIQRFDKYEGNTGE